MGNAVDVDGLAEAVRAVREAPLYLKGASADVALDALVSWARSIEARIEGVERGKNERRENEVLGVRAGNSGSVGR